MKADKILLLAALFCSPLCLGAKQIPAQKSDPSGTASARQSVSGKEEQSATLGSADGDREALKISSGGDSEISKSPVRARPSGDGVDLSTITVTDEADLSTTEGADSYTTGNMNTATGLDLSIRQTPQSVSVISDKLIKDQNFKTIKEAMSYAPGVSVTTDTGGGSRSRFQARGFDIDNIQEDGLASPAASSVQGTLYTAKELSDLVFYDRIEVLRGVAGLTQSNAVPGGTINLLRKKPQSEFKSDLSAGVSGFAGGKRSYEGAFDVTGGLNELSTVRARLIGSLQKTNSFKEGVEGKKGSVGAMLGFDVGDSNVLNLGAIYQKSKDVPDVYGLPALRNGKSVEFKRSKFFGSRWDEEIFKKINVFGDLTHYFSNDWSAALKLNYTKSDMNMKFAQLWNTPAGLVQRQKYDTSSDEINAKLDLNGKFELFGQSNDAFMSAQISRDKFRGNDKWMRPLVGLYNMNNFTRDSIPEPDWSRPFRDASSNLSVRQRSLAAGTRLNFTDAWHLLVGARFSSVQYGSWGWTKLPFGFTRNEKKNLKNSKITPYAGLTWDFAQNHSLYFSYAKIFKPQMNEKENGDFVKPVLGSNAEFGLKSEYFDGALNSSVALFQTLLQNKAVPDPRLYPSNYWIDGGKIRTRGFEAEISGKLTRDLQILAGYTYAKSVYLEDEKVHPSLSAHAKGEIANAYVPRRIFRLYTSYAPPALPGLNFGLGGRYQSRTGSYYKGAFAAPPQKSYTLLDAHVGYKFNKNFGLNFAIRNIADKKYFINSMNRSADRLNYYGEPRRLTLTLNYTY